MEELIFANIYTIILLPLWLFLVIMLGRFFSVYINKRIIQIFTLLTSLLGAISSLGLYKLFTPDKVFENIYPFIKINDFIIPFGIHIDRLSLIFASVLFLVSFFIQLFSISYTKDEKKQYRFFALLNLFNFAMSGLFFSPNLFQTYVFWEIAGVLSYLLIGFDYDKFEKSLASKKVFIMNRIGDTSFLAGIILCSYLLYEYAPVKSLASLSFYDMNVSGMLVGVYTSKLLFLIICSLFVIGAVVKSAQFPFYTWLQDAMEAKIPVSALLHSATLVALGVYLTIRMLPLYTLDAFVLKAIACIGIFTAILCSFSACAQTNPKKALAYSTSAQLGLMFFAIGVLNIKAGVALFCAHALIKSMLFITLPNESEKWSYTKFILFLIGGLSLSGLMFAGLISKEMLAYSLGSKGTTVVSVLSFLTAFYIMRIALVTADNNGLEKQKTNITELFSYAGLIGLNIGLYIYLRQTGGYQIAEPFWAAMTGWLFVYILYKKQSFYKIPYIYPLCLNGFYLDKFYMTAVSGLYNKISNLLAAFDLKILGNYRLQLGLSKSCVKIISGIETNIMNGAVASIVDFSRRVSAISKQLQTKNVQWYNFYGFIIITAIMSALVIAYSAILAYIKGVG